MPFSLEAFFSEADAQSRLVKSLSDYDAGAYEAIKVIAEGFPIATLLKELMEGSDAGTYHARACWAAWVRVYWAFEPGPVPLLSAAAFRRRVQEDDMMNRLQMHVDGHAYSYNSDNDAQIARGAVPRFVNIYDVVDNLIADYPDCFASLATLAANGYAETAMRALAFWLMTHPLIWV